MKYLVCARLDGARGGALHGRLVDRGCVVRAFDMWFLYAKRQSVESNIEVIS